MLFLVDGYNVTRDDPATRTLPLEAQREALVRRLASRGPAMLGQGRIVVVFDASGGVSSGPESLGPVEVRFARSGTADDALVHCVEHSSEQVVLVTSDGGLVARARGMARCGLEVRPRDACFESAGQGAARRDRGPRPPRDVGLPDGANRITEELKRLWLDGSEGGR